MLTVTPAETHESMTRVTVKVQSPVPNPHTTCVVPSKFVVIIPGGPEGPIALINHAPVEGKLPKSTQPVVAPGGQFG
jgi:hypothetical protein